MLDRRAFLLSSAALAGCATVAEPPVAGAASRDAALDALLSAWFDDDLNESPEFVTGLGLDTGARAAQRGRLSQQSPAAAAAERAEAVQRYEQLRRFGRARLSAEGQLNYDIAEFRQSVAAEGARFPYGEIGGRPAPYVVSQLGGAYYEVPDFLDSQHPVQTKADADFYLSRLGDFARNIDGETQRFGADVARGVIPPDFVMDGTIRNLERLRATPAAQTTLVAPSPVARPKRTSATTRHPRRRWCPARSPPRSIARSPPCAPFVRAPPTTLASGGCRTARPSTVGACASTPPRIARPTTSTPSACSRWANCRPSSIRSFAPRATPAARWASASTR
jgi:hypothetical protein